MLIVLYQLRKLLFLYLNCFPLNLCELSGENFKLHYNYRLGQYLLTFIEFYKYKYLFKILIFISILIKLKVLFK